MAALPEVIIPGRTNWKYEKRKIKCTYKKCTNEVMIEGDTTSCFNSGVVCSHCASLIKEKN